MPRIEINKIEPNEVDRTVNYIDTYDIEVTEEERDYVYENIGSIIQPNELYHFNDLKPFE